MKIIISLFFYSCLFLNVHLALAQDIDKNKKLNATIKFSYINNTKLINTFSVPGQGDFTNIIDPSSSFTASFNFLMGYYVIPEKLFLGFGTGIDGYNNPDFNTAPLYFDVHFYFKKSRMTPYIYGAYGGLIKYGVIFERGIYGRFGFGFTFFTTQKLKIALDISYTPVGISLTNQSYLNSDDRVSVQGYGLTLGFILF